MLTIGIIAAYFAWPGWVSILVLSTAMGIMNTTITRIGGQAVSVGFVTGDLNNLGQHLAMGLKRAPRKTNARPMRHSLAAGRPVGRHMDCIDHGSRAWSSVGGSRLAIWTLLLPALMLVVLALLDRAAISGV
jgi:hypothetical protein